MMSYAPTSYCTVPLETKNNKKQQCVIAYQLGPRVSAKPGLWTGLDWTDSMDSDLDCSVELVM